MTLKVGDQAPEFTLLSDQDVSISLKQFHGKPVVLYFYPKDNTPGCTREACDFRDQFSEFKKLGVEVLGISKDGVKAHQKFKEKYSLPFTLLVDDDAEVCIAYGVIKKKSLFGKSFLGINRSTFLIDAKGKIKAIWRNVKVTGHVEQILNELNS